MYDLIIVGGGPAGLTATIYALRLRLNVLVITKDLGGKTNHRLQIPNLNQHLVINGAEVVDRFINEIEYLQFARVLDSVRRITIAPDETGGGAACYAVETHGGTDYTTRAIIVATGAQPTPLEVPGEREFLMRGLSYSAVSYAPLFAAKSVAVVGDTNLALRATAELARVARQVTLVAPGRGELYGPLGLKLRTAPNVAMLEGYRVTQINGSDYARSLTLERDGNVRELAADAFFVELGLQPNSMLVAKLVDLDDDGRIMIDSCNRTSAAGIFAAGDVTDACAEQVLIAIGEGAKAALSAYDYILGLPVAEHTPVTADEWR
jgi:thioredoxin reductase